MTFKTRGLAAAAVLCALVHGVIAAPVASSPRGPVPATGAAKLMTIPTTVSSQSDAEIERAAVASRRDQDPGFNGSVKDNPTPASASAASLRP